MTISDLEKKVAAAEEKVAKCQKTILRHQAQMEKKAKQLQELGVDPDSADRVKFARSNLSQDREIYFLLYDYDRKKDDIEGATRKLQDAQNICANWKVKLDQQINIEKVIANDVPKIIQDFLQDWKEKTFSWYIRRYSLYQERKAELAEAVKEAKREALRTLPEYAKDRERFGDRLYTDDYFLYNVWPRKPMEAFLKEQELDDKSVKQTLSYCSDGTILRMCDFRKEDEREAWLDAHLEEAKKDKLMWFYINVSKITGPITDAKHLIMSGGDLNGVVIGEKGAANIQTFSAGGWNIQCFHFRTRIDDVTKKVFKPTLDEMIHSSSAAASTSAKETAKSSQQEKGR